MDKKEQRKERAIHRRARRELLKWHWWSMASKGVGQNHRYMILTWTFLRGLPFHRAENHHRVQVITPKTIKDHHTAAGGKVTFTHNMPDVSILLGEILILLVEILRVSPLELRGTVEAWLKLPGPEVEKRPKRPLSKEEKQRCFESGHAKREARAFMRAAQAEDPLIRETVKVEVRK